MEIDKERLKKMLPHLSREMNAKTDGITITSVRSNTQTREDAPSKRVEGCTPDVIDFLRRCDNTQQAEEILGFLERRHEISSEYAKKLRNQLKENGLRSFGPKKEDDYYFKQAEH